MNNICSYNNALKFIQNKQSLGVKPGLSRIKEALDKAGNPQNSYKIIHIAGTNGKGTVAATISKALQKQGYKVGLFTSPWVIDYREQIQINGEFIPEENFTYCVKNLEAVDCDCTEFESLVLVAYLYFAREKVDFAVIECGMGGKGDATNVEDSNLSVITSISIDHTDFLGNSLDEIAEEKSGVLRKNCTCVLYNDELKAHFENKCKKLITGGLKDNLSLVNAVLKELKVEKEKELVRLPARQERIGGVLLDGGHNLGAAKMLEPQINCEVAVISMMRDKEVDGYLSVIAPKCRRIIVTQADNERVMPAPELYLIANKYCNDVEIVISPENAIKEEGVSLVCGSFYLARQIRNLL